MLKTPEDYLSDLNFESPLPDDKNPMLDSAERVFVEKYLGLDILEAMPAEYPERVSPPLPVLMYEKPSFPTIEVVQEPSLKSEETASKVEILDKPGALQIIVVPDEPVAESALLETSLIKEEILLETEVQEKTSRDNVSKVITDLKEESGQDTAKGVKSSVVEDIKEDIVKKNLVKDIIASTVINEVEQRQEELPAPVVNKIPSPAELALQATSVMRDKLKSLAEVQIFSFCISKQVFLLPVPCIQEVIKYTELVKVPQAPGFIAGAINLRGNVIPLIFLSALLTNNVDHFYDENKFVIVCGTEQTKVGLIVDKINGMHFLPQDKIIWNAEAKIGDASEYLYAIANFNDRVCGLVAPELITQKILES